MRCTIYFIVLNTPHTMNFLNSFKGAIASSLSSLSKGLYNNDDNMDIDVQEPEEAVSRPTVPVFSTIERTVELSTMSVDQTLVAIDTSGSTMSDNVLQREIKMVQPFGLSCDTDNNGAKVTSIKTSSTCTAIQWSSNASVIQPNSSVQPHSNGTDPSAIFNLMSQNTSIPNSKVFILVTDGEINQGYVTRMAEIGSEKIANTPLTIAVIVLKELPKTPEELNVSVVASLMAFSNSFACFVTSPSSEVSYLVENKGISELPIPDLGSWETCPKMEPSSLIGLVQLRGYSSIPADHFVIGNLNNTEGDTNNIIQTRIVNVEALMLALNFPDLVQEMINEFPSQQAFCDFVITRIVPILRVQGNLPVLRRLVRNIRQNIVPASETNNKNNNIDNIIEEVHRFRSIQSPSAEVITSFKTAQATYQKIRDSRIVLEPLEALAEEIEDIFQMQQEQPETSFNLSCMTSTPKKAFTGSKINKRVIVKPNEIVNPQCHKNNQGYICNICYTEKGCQGILFIVGDEPISPVQCCVPCLRYMMILKKCPVTRKNVIGWIPICELTPQMKAYYTHVLKKMYTSDVEETFFYTLDAIREKDWAIEGFGETIIYMMKQLKNNYKMVADAVAESEELQKLLE